MFHVLPPLAERVRVTRAAAAAHNFELREVRCRTSQYRRCFVPRSVALLNSFPSAVFGSSSLSGFNSAVNSWLLGG